jgi:transposase
MAYKMSERNQMNLFPAVIDDYVSKDDPVRVYDAFVDALNLVELGISIDPYKSGAHEYYPKDMLKLLMYGYSYGIRSSRKLERACCHNLSFIWLMGGLKPDYRTISRFRAEYKGAIKNVLKQCARMCIKLDLIEGNALFVDGSPFRANASIRNTWTIERCEKHIKDLSSRIDDLVDESVDIDTREEGADSLVKIKKELADKTALKKRLEDIASELKESQKPLLNTTDPDCVISKSRQGTHASYNAQVTVDEKHGLIVNSEAVSHSQDYNKFSDQVSKATAVLEKKPEAAVSDCGYYSLDDIAKVDKDIAVIMPSIKQAQKEKGLHPVKPFSKEQFKYNPSKDEYICPEGKRLKYIGRNLRRKNRYYQADKERCRSCRHSDVCVSSSNNGGRIISRMSEEELQDKLKAVYLSAKGQEIYKLRKQKVELPFGHMKRNLGAGQFMLRTKPKVDAELSILSTCFNIARMMTIMGIPKLLQSLNGS